MATKFYAGSCERMASIFAIVESSMIRNMEWNNFSGNGEMTVRFWSGDTYIYEGVSLGTFVMVSQCPSVGKAFNEVIKGNFEYRKMPSLQPVAV